VLEQQVFRSTYLVLQLLDRGTAFSSLASLAIFTSTAYELTMRSHTALPHVHSQSKCQTRITQSLILLHIAAMRQVIALVSARAGRWNFIFLSQRFVTYVAPNPLRHLGIIHRRPLFREFLAQCTCARPEARAFSNLSRRKSVCWSADRSGLVRLAQFTFYL
jgi:hypothetical protein